MSLSNYRHALRNNTEERRPVSDLLSI